MSNIDVIRIQGYQSHVDSRLNLAPGLNVITGPSDAGKTAVIRAVRWVAFNEPAGEAFLNESVGEATVQLELSSGVSVTKRRRKGKTSYELSTLDEPFEKAEVPEEVQLALGIMKQGFGDFETALNFSFQLEAPFLISETASAGAKVLGKLAGTEVVDMATKSVAKDTYQARQEKAAADKDIQRIDGYLLEFDDLEGLKQQLEACQLIVSECDEKLSKSTKLEELERIRETVSEKLQSVAEKLDSLSVVPDIEEDLKNIEKAQQRYDRLLDLYSLLNKATDQVAVFTERLHRLVNLDEIASTLSSAESGNQRVHVVSSLYAGYQKYAQAVNETEQIVASIGDVTELGELLNSVAAGHIRLASAVQLSSKVARILSDIDDRNTFLEQFEKSGDLQDLLASAEEALKRQKAFETVTSVYQNANTNLNAKILLLGKAEEDLETAQQEHVNAWEGIEVCPLCEQPVSGGDHIGRH